MPRSATETNSAAAADGTVLLLAVASRHANNISNIVCLHQQFIQPSPVLVCVLQLPETESGH